MIIKKNCYKSFPIPRATISREQNQLSIHISFVRRYALSQMIFREVLKMPISLSVPRTMMNCQACKLMINSYYKLLIFTPMVISSSQLIMVENFSQKYFEKGFGAEIPKKHSNNYPRKNISSYSGKTRNYSKGVSPIYWYYS